MKIITRAVWQMTPAGYELLEEQSFDHSGPIAHAKGGSAPKAPDPAVQANAEAAANRVDTIGPGGSETYSQGGREIIGYDSKGNPQYGVRSTRTITLDPSEQRQYDARQQIAEQLLGRGLTRAQGGDFNFDSATPEVAQAQYKKTIQLLKPSFDRANESFDQKMANAGIPIGSEAWKDAKMQLDQGQNQSLERAALDSTTYGNQLALQQRQQQYNELAAALGSSQLNQVNTGGGGGAAPIDVAGAYDREYQGQLAGYNARQAEIQGNTQAGAGLVGAGITAAVVL